MPTLIMESSPKFITCPDCGERYDNARKRRLIDTCGHPRCYSCLFVDKPCPLCDKLPKQRPRSSSSTKTETENLEKTGNLKQSKEYVGSHPNLSKLKEMHKDRSATLPTSFRRDSYFRSLYRYEPHGSSENLSTSPRSSSPPSQRPKSMPPSYHKSLDNLHEQFWKSVQLAESKCSRAKTSKKKDSDESSADEEKSNTAQSPVSPPPPPEIIDCPAPDVVRLPVPSSARPRSPRVLYHHMTAEERMNELRQEISRKAQEQKESRPRSCSDILQPQSLKNIKNDVIDLGTTASTRPQSWSHIQFPTSTNAQGIPYGYRSSSSLSDRSFDSRNSFGSSPPSSWSPMLHRSSSPQNYSSDKSSDVSSIYLSDNCSVSSGDSDSLHSGVRSPSYKNERGFNIPRPHSALENYSGGSSPSQSRRRLPVNPLANVTYWVVDSGKKPLDVQQGLQETNIDEAIRHRPSNTHAQTHWNGQTNRSPAAVTNVRTGVNTI